MRRILIAFVLATMAPAQSGSLAALVASVRTALHNRPDSEVAQLIRTATLTDRLEDAVLEQLQTEGAGPLALEELDRQRDRTRNLPKPATAHHLFDAPPPPTAEEESRIVLQAGAYAAQYSQSLPNFLCTETIRRYTSPELLRAWEARDTLTVSVSYTGKREEYKLLAINGKATGKSLSSAGGFQFSGEFGSVLHLVFEAESATQFHWERWTNLRGHPAHVFSFRIDLAHSKYVLKGGSPLKPFRLVSGMRGLVYIDRDNGRVLRYTAGSDGLPAGGPVRSTIDVQDYDYAEIRGQQYLLPRRVDSRVELRKGVRRNVTEYGAYRKFSSDATVTFDKQ